MNGKLFEQNLNIIIRSTYRIEEYRAFANGAHTEHLKLFFGLIIIILRLMKKRTNQTDMESKNC